MTAAGGPDIACAWTTKLSREVGMMRSITRVHEPTAASRPGGEPGHCVHGTTSGTRYSLVPSYQMATAIRPARSPAPGTGTKTAVIDSLARTANSDSMTAEQRGALPVIACRLRWRSPQDLWVTGRVTEAARDFARDAERCYSEHY